MYILELTAEIAPYSHTGGLARGIRFLSAALIKRGHDVRVMTPLHYHVVEYFLKQKGGKQPKKISYVEVQTGTFNAHTSSTIKVDIIEYKQNTVNPHIYFIDYADYFLNRSSIYGYHDDFRRFYLFSIACCNWLLNEFRQSKKKPDVIHCHDWHTGYFINALKDNKQYALLSDIPVVFTVHNFKYQNENKFQYMDEAEIDLGKTPLADFNSPILKEQNALTRGMVFAERINTVSPTHAREILLPEYSYNLSAFMPKVKNKLSGILNGLDYHEFDPSTHPQIHYHYTEVNFSKQRKKNKLHLRKVFSLPDNGAAPLFCYVGRMTSQKGLEALLNSMRAILVQFPRAQLISLGDGEDHYCELFWKFTKIFPHQAKVKLIHDVNLPSKIFAGADITLIPSNYEPGGIVTLEALRYGSAPIARRTGGLMDIVTPYSSQTKQGNGFLYNTNTPNLLTRTIRSALKLYQKPKQWNCLVYNCMIYKRAWNEVAIEYERLFVDAKNI